jgi:hypothetical protein
MKSHPGKLLLFLFIAALVTSCTKDERLMYEQDPRVYFLKYPRISQTNPDSVLYTFGIKPASQQTDTVYVSLRIMGSPENRDREVNLMALDSSTAKPGYHYNFGPLIIPANEFGATIPVYLFKQPGLKDSIVTLYLTIGESKDFKPGYTDKANSFQAFDRLLYKISITDQLVKPSNWDGTLASAFGTYSKVKYQFMIVSTGKVDWRTGVFPADLNFLAAKVKAALLEHEQSNGPLIDEAGNRVVFP